MAQLSKDEFCNLLKTAFSLKPEDKNLAILVDLPRSTDEDTPEWKARRRMAFQWIQYAREEQQRLGLEKADLLVYPNVGSNNADLPEKLYVASEDPSELDSAGLAERLPSVTLAELGGYQILLAPTQYSATAPLKHLARKYRFRAATMPGFSAAMIPALRLDWSEIDRRVGKIKTLLDAARIARITFQVEKIGEKKLTLDLRYRKAHASGGRFPEPGIAGNLPSGECYIVPYEGEKGEPSRSQGELPVQFGDEVVIYKVENNRAVDVLSEGPKSDSERQLLRQEPAYGNLAELGFGILTDFGLEPIGQILLDEKLGLHIAFGRSDHFGGATAPEHFRNPANVIHIDRIYIPATQPAIQVRSVLLENEDGSAVELIKDGRYTIF
jgi:hypothetical protein